MNKFLQHPNCVCKPLKTMHSTSSRKLKPYERSSPHSTNRLNTKTHLEMNSMPLSECISPCSINTMHLDTSQPIVELDIHEHQLNQNTKKKTYWKGCNQEAKRRIPYWTGVFKEASP